MTDTGDTLLSAEQVRKVAALAKLAPDGAEVERLRSELGAVLAYARGLAALDLEGIEPLTTPLELTGPLADDVPGRLEAGTVMVRDALLEMAPSVDGVYVKVPKVLGDGGGA